MDSYCFRLSAVLLLAATGLLQTSAFTVNHGEQVTTCDWYPMNIHHLHCDHGVITVRQALYGRANSHICTEGKSPRELANVKCSRPGTTEQLKKSCDGKSMCEVAIDDFRTPDPCVDTFKYLQTNFSCLPAVTCVVCEESEARLYCEHGQVIFVFGADFGRRDQTTCARQKPLSEIQNVQCVHPTDIVAKRCNGKKSCRIMASRDVFGEPCEGTYKYLEVSYTCHYPGQNF
ncbi:L-rhamnose-binding lectin SML-like [Hippocampus zosterae]|uniref:L-rhamnose-binding lectin SML-like n=1 Tax=Hippocampus zosterae TaxID=109293 RepID=UPI00223D7B9C|nr:L-rhamnose-binding lectin SML-like [Hippocampus zosterae]